MKRIIDGVTYNTDSSTRIARSEYYTEYNHENLPCEGILYQTRGGAFFVHQCISRGNDEDGQEITKDRFEALSATEAEEWFNAGEVEPYANPFGDDPPEAEAEASPGATIYVRVPALLKRRVEEASENANLSANAYVLRCLESCLTKTEESAAADKVLRNMGLIK